MTTFNEFVSEFIKEQGLPWEPMTVAKVVPSTWGDKDTINIESIDDDIFYLRYLPCIYYYRNSKGAIRIGSTERRLASKNRHGVVARGSGKHYNGRVSVMLASSNESWVRDVLREHALESDCYLDVIPLEDYLKKKQWWVTAEYVQCELLRKHKEVFNRLPIANPVCK